MTTNRRTHLVPTVAQCQELARLGRWVKSPPVQELPHEKIVNALLHNGIRTLDELYPVYVAIRDRLDYGGEVQENAWAERARWLPLPLDGLGARSVARIVDVYDSWAAVHPTAATAIAENYTRRSRAKHRHWLALRAYIVDGMRMGQIAEMLGVTTERTRQMLRATGFTRELQQLFDINVAWQKYLNGQPCADEGLSPCDGPHERSYFTWWLKPGPLQIVCARHGKARAESVEDW